jgi:hypothetical protein
MLATMKNTKSTRYAKRMTIRLSDRAHDAIGDAVHRLKRADATRDLRVTQDEVVNLLWIWASDQPATVIERIVLEYLPGFRVDPPPESAPGPLRPSGAGDLRPLGPAKTVPKPSNRRPKGQKKRADGAG